MAVVDFSDSPLLLKPLDLKYGGVVYEVRPTADDQARMVRMRRAIMASVRDESEKAPSVRDRLDPDDRVLAEDDEVLSRVQLGVDAYEQMLADGVPFPDIRRLANYSYNYHTGGAEYAEAMLKMQTNTELGIEDGDDSSGEFPKPSKSGRSTASGSRTKTASTGAIGRPRSATATRAGSRAKKK